MKKSIILLAILTLISLLLVGCDTNNNSVQSNNSGDSTISSGEAANGGTNESNEDEEDFSKIEQNPLVTLEIKDLGTVRIELYPQIAPNTVKNFIELVSSGFYDGLTFHRTIPGFMAQGGDPSGDGTGGPDYTIKGEFSSNGVNNDLEHKRGVISMARSQENDSAGSQFFIVTTDSPYLNGDYAAFGMVIEGMDVVDKIVNSEVLRREEDVDISLAYTNIDEYIKQISECDRPVNPPVIEKATVETFGVEYGEVKKIK